MKKWLLSICFLLVPTLVLAATITLQWDANDQAPDGYRIYQRVEGESYDYSATPACDTQSTSCTVTNLLPATTYYFVARAYMNDEESGDSNEVSFKGPVDAPANLRINFEISFYIDINGNPIVVKN